MRKRHIRVTGIRRDPPDVKLLATALLELAQDLERRKMESRNAQTKRSTEPLFRRARRYHDLTAVSSSGAAGALADRLLLLFAW